MRHPRRALADASGVALAAAVLSLFGCGDGPKGLPHNQNTVPMYAAAKMTDGVFWEVEAAVGVTDCQIVIYEEGPEGFRQLHRGERVFDAEGRRHFVGFVRLADHSGRDSPPVVRLFTGSDDPINGNAYSRDRTASWAFMEAMNTTMAAGVKVRLSTDEITCVGSVKYNGLDFGEPPKAGGDDGEVDRAMTERKLYLAVEYDPSYTVTSNGDWQPELPDRLTEVSRYEVRCLAMTAWSETEMSDRDRDAFVLA